LNHFHRWRHLFLDESTDRAPALPAARLIVDAI